MVDLSKIINTVASVVGAVKSEGTTANGDSGGGKSTVNSVFDAAAGKTGTTQADSTQTAKQDASFEAFTKMAEKTAGKKLGEFTKEEFQAAMKAFKASQTPAKAAPARTADTDPNNKKIKVEDAINLVDDRDTAGLTKAQFDALTPEQQAKYKADMKKALTGE